jgi:hypothetical protein
MAGATFDPYLLDWHEGMDGPETRVASVRSARRGPIDADQGERAMIRRDVRLRPGADTSSNDETSGSQNIVPKRFDHAVAVLANNVADICSWMVQPVPAHPFQTSTG